MIEQGCDNDKGKGVAEGKSVVTSVVLENLFGIFSYTVAIGYDPEPRLYLVEKQYGGGIMPSVTKQRRRFADNIPGGEERRSLGGIGNNLAGMVMVDVPGIKAGVEERGIAEHTARKRHYRYKAPSPYR